MGEQKRRYQARDGVTRDLIYDTDRPFSLTVHTRQDVGPILDGIHRDRELPQRGTNRHVARLPMFVVEDLMHRGIYDDEDAFKKWLNGPEAAPWRIWRGAV